MSSFSSQTAAFTLEAEVLAAFCQRNRIHRLSLFGSRLKGNARADSDVDLLAEVDEGHAPGMFALTRMEMELSELLGHKVDLRTPGDLSRYFRDEVQGMARVQYAA